MPLYEYACKGCNHSFSQIQKIDDRKLPESEPCPACSKVEVVMTISAVKISYSANNGGMKMTESFKDRLKDIAKKVPAAARDSLTRHI